MAPVLDANIDELYRQPLDTFTDARAALAKGLKGDEARRVKQLKKPTTVPWAVNQVYWRARAAFDRVLKTGAALRRAQLGVLEGRSGDVRGASKEQREAVSAAVAKAVDLASAADVHPDRDALTQTFEALSLATEPPEPHGRLTKPLRPGGFEMLTGIKPATHPGRSAPSADREERGVVHAFTPRQAGGALSLSKGRLAGDGKRPRGVRLEPDLQRKREALAKKREQAAARKLAHQEAAARKHRDAAIRKAEAALARAREHEAKAEQTWREAQEAVTKATRARRDLD